MSEVAASAQGVAAVAVVVNQQTMAAGAAVAHAKPAPVVPSPIPWLQEVPADAPKPKPPRVAYLHDTKILIAAIWPDAPPTATLDDIAAKARAHREIFEQYGARIATSHP